MPVSFNTIPSNWRQPLYWVEVDGSMAGFPVSHMRSLLVGIMRTQATDPADNGVGVPNVPIPIGRQMDVDHLFGQGSEIACMFRAYFANNFANEIWALPVAEPPSGTAATGTITVVDPPLEAGTISLYIAGYAIRVNLPATATINDVATAIADAVNDPLYQNKGVPVDAVAATNVVTLTCKWKGKNGNMITMRDSYYGKIGGEELPVGLTLSYQAHIPGSPGPVVGPSFTLQGGVGIPDFTAAIAAMGETEFEYVALPYTDSTTLLAWEEEYGFGDNGRWGHQAPLLGNWH